jgi:hypothetical protein
LTVPYVVPPLKEPINVPSSMKPIPTAVPPEALLNGPITVTMPVPASIFTRLSGEAGESLLVAPQSVPAASVARD